MNALPSTNHARALLRSSCLRAPLLAALALSQFAACGAQSDDVAQNDSTDTGNPPVLVEQKLSVEESGDGVVVSGEAGAVTADASVEVTNLETDVSESTTADSDGSFEVSIRGSIDDEYEVRVEAGGENTTASVSGSAGPSFIGKDFELDSADGFMPLPETTVRISFTDSEMRFSAGCNSHFGEYELCDASLCISGFGATEIGCGEERSNQDDWLADFFTSTPTLTEDGDSLSFENDDATLVFLDSEVADPDRPLTGRTWTIDTFITGDAASNIALEIDPTVTFDEDGTFQALTTCNELGGTFSVEGQTITFTEVGTTDRACTDMGSQFAEDHITRVISVGDVDFEIDAARLDLIRGDVGLSATTE